MPTSQLPLCCNKLFKVLQCNHTCILVLTSPLQKSTVIFTIAVDTNCLTKLDKSFRCQAETFQAGEGESSHLPC